VADRGGGKHDEGETTASASGGSPSPGSEARDPYLALRFRDFRLLLIGVFVGSFGQQMVSVALGWELYNRTGSALVLGGIGLAQVVPVILLSLPAGHIADRYSRKYVVLFAEIGLGVASLGLAGLSAERGPLWLIYGCLFVMGTAQTFSGPASTAMISQVIPVEVYESATTWRSSSWQLSAVLGPATSGFLIGLLGAATVVYVLNGVASLIVAFMIAIIRVHREQVRAAEARTWLAVIEGLRFLGQTQVLLAAITLDLFAVLFGGAVTLLPIFARNILHVGPVGLGWLQAASSLGAVVMALVLAHRPAFSRAGRTLLLAVAGFGLATMVFGISRWFWLSMLMLFVLGALDNISVVIRSTLLLLRAPDEMRGRIGAVNSLFVSTSNQLGGFESGVAAQLFGPVVAVVAGGAATLLVVALVAWTWPEMRNLRTLSERPRAA
jgi:MFS family permease